MKVIFLDVDGCLNRLLPDHPQFQPECCENLCAILRATEAGVVISSSWRYLMIGDDEDPPSMNAAGFKALLRTHEIKPLRLLGHTCSDEELPGRGKQIRRWLAHNRVLRGIERYCVIDDEDDGISELHGKSFVRTDPRNGLTPGNAADVIALLTRVASPQPEPLC